MEAGPDLVDRNTRSRSSSAGKRCSIATSTFGVLDCPWGEGDVRQDVEAGGAGGRPCEGNRGKGEGRGEFEAELNKDVPLPGTVRLVENDSPPVAPKAFWTSPSVGAGARSDASPSPSNASFGLFGARKRLAVSERREVCAAGFTLGCCVNQGVPDAEAAATAVDDDANPRSNESPNPAIPEGEPCIVL